MIVLQALSGVGEAIEERAQILQNTALSAALNTQFLFQIGIFTAVPMILGFILELGFLKVNRLSYMYLFILLITCRVLISSLCIYTYFSSYLRKIFSCLLHHATEL